MKRTVLCFLIILASTQTAFPQAIQGTAAHNLSTPHPSKEAVALYRYLQDMSGKKTLSGQMCTPWGFDELAYIKTITGKQPAIQGMDFITQKDNEKEVQLAIHWWKEGGIPTIMWHWGAPGKGEGYEASKMTIDINQCFVKGTVEYKSFWKELKTKADLLEKLRNAHIPVLWRPFHELNGNWFWWSKEGPTEFKKLWITEYNYFVKKRKLNNLIWVLGYTAQPDSAWYPGDQYVDVVGADIYNHGDGPQATMDKKVKAIFGTKFPIAYHECGIPPNPDQCIKQNIIWSWWMEWHTNFLKGVDPIYLKQVYNNPLIITLDKMPNIMKTYGLTSNK